jgi:hypothetical protein
MTPKNKRDYPRINTLLPFEVRRLAPGESRGMGCRMTRDVLVIDDAPPPVEDERVNAWMNMLNAKLDYLIRITVPRQEAFEFLSFEPLNISAGGMSLTTKEKIAIGELLEIRMVLETYPAKVLYLLGEVVRVGEMEDKPGTFTLGLRYVEIDETIRREIVNFDFKKHRERLITRRKP